MHRMRRRFAQAGLAVLLLLGGSRSGSAALLRPQDSWTFSDVAAFASGTQTYQYDPSSGTGVFQLTGSPFLLTEGKASDAALREYGVTSSGSVPRSESVVAVLDSSGNLVASPLNSYTLYGTVTIGNQTYSGLLLQGTPVAFGSRNLTSAAVGEDLFDLQLRVTGGVLASQYGSDAYIRVTAESNSTFRGLFNVDFSSEQILATTQRLTMATASPVPEPTAMVVLLACGAGWFYRGRRRIASSDLEV